MKNTKKVVVGSLATIAVSCALIGGATLAYFTDDASTNIAITAGNVEITATVKDDFKLWSMDELQTETFANGGTVEYKDGELIIDRITPGDKVAFDIEVTNKSDVAIKYQTQLTATNALLLSGLDVTIDEEKLTAEGMVVVSAWKEVEAYADIDDIHVEIELPKEAGNEYKLQSCTLNIAVNAIQANGDTSDMDLIKIADDHYIANSVASLKAFVNANNAGEFQSIKAKENCVTLDITADIDLAGIEWVPMNAFRVNINGNGHTISNINAVSGYQSGFLSYLGGSTVKDLTLENVKASGQQVGAVAGQIEDGVFENVKLAGTVQIVYTEVQNGAKGIGAFIGVWANGSLSQISVEEDASIKLICERYDGFEGEADSQHYFGNVFNGNYTPSTNLEEAVANPGDVEVELVNASYIYNDETKTYHIYSADGLRFIGAQVDLYTANGNQSIESSKGFSGKTIKLEVDIDLNNELWTPIGMYQYGNQIQFQGTFDGNDHTIYNLMTDSSDRTASAKASYGSGLISYLGGSGTVKNLTICNADVKGTSYFTGVVVGNAVANSTISNITLTGNIQATCPNFVGALAGYVAGNVSDIKIEAAEGSLVKGTNGVGGVIGTLQGTTVVKNITTNIDVEISTAYGAAAVIGRMQGTSHTLDNITATGNVTGTTSSAVVGALTTRVSFDDTAPTVVVNNFNYTGKISCDIEITGIVTNKEPANFKSTFTFTNSKAVITLKDGSVVTYND